MSSLASGRLLRHLLFLFLLASLSGCGVLIPDLAEHSYPMVPERLIHVTQGKAVTTHEWVSVVHLQLAPLLPPGRNEALTTDEISVHGAPVNVWARFNLKPENLDNLFLNLRSIEQTSQVASPSANLSGAHPGRPGWPGFHEVKVPVSRGGELYGRLGIPDEQYEVPGSYIIMTHGLFGSLDGADVMNQVQALRRAGHHVLAIEMRGHGMTSVAHPEYAMTFVIEDSCDLLAAARWLKSTHHATHVGLVSFSLTAFESLLVAWLDGTAPVTEFATLPFHPLLPPHEAAPAFDSMFVVSAPIGIVEVASRFEPSFNLLEAPVKATFQHHVHDRLMTCGETPGYTMWNLARSEFPRSELARLYPSFDAERPDLLRFLDLSAHDWNTGASRMENIRVPVLVLNAASDPLATAQSVSELFSRQHNPNIGVILLKEGGHIGFTAYSADYYYSLMTNFFDPATAPRPAERLPQPIAGF